MKIQVMLRAQLVAEVSTSAAGAYVGSTLGILLVLWTKTSAVSVLAKMPDRLICAPRTADTGASLVLQAFLASEQQLQHNLTRSQPLTAPPERVRFGAPCQACFASSQRCLEMSCGMPEMLRSCASTFRCELVSAVHLSYTPTYALHAQSRRAWGRCGLGRVTWRGEVAAEETVRIALSAS